MSEETFTEIKLRIEKESKRLGLDPKKLMSEYGVTSALAEMLEKQKIGLK